MKMIHALYRKKELKILKGIGKEFIELTKYENLEPSDQSAGLPQPPLEIGYDLKNPVLNLPRPETIRLGDVSLRKVLEERHSIRKYAEKPLTLEELAYLLWCTQGVQSVRGNAATIRTVPSAGARHAFETWLLINRVEGLQPGLYRYLALEHKLVEESLAPDMAERITAGCLGQGFVGTSAVTFLWMADVQRMKWRYGERGYRYLHLDAGHICQNLYLAAESIDCGTCAIAAFNDDELSRILQIDGVEQFVVYMASLGKK
jgi:SagB-type dehydrogenase family enzyme